MTITGIGTSNGAPVGFVFVAVQTSPTSPGSVSFNFSDGYTNAGHTDKWHDRATLRD